MTHTCAFCTSASRSGGFSAVPIAHVVLEAGSGVARLQLLLEQPRLPHIVRRPRADGEELLERTNVLTQEELLVTVTQVDERFDPLLGSEVLRAGFVVPVRLVEGQHVKVFHEETAVLRSDTTTNHQRNLNPALHVEDLVVQQLPKFLQVMPHVEPPERL